MISIETVFQVRLSLRVTKTTGVKTRLLLLLLGLVGFTHFGHATTPQTLGHAVFLRRCVTLLFLVFQSLGLILYFLESGVAAVNHQHRQVGQ